MAPSLKLVSVKTFRKSKNKTINTLLLHVFYLVNLKENIMANFYENNVAETKATFAKTVSKKIINQQDLYLIRLNMKFLRMLLRTDLVQKDSLFMGKIKRI